MVEAVRMLWICAYVPLACMVKASRTTSLKSLPHLPSVETRFHCPQAFLTVSFQCRDDVDKFNADVLGFTRAFAEAGNGVSQLTVALVAILDVLPQLLLGQGVALAGHMTCLCCGFLQHQAATVVPNAAHHIQTPRSTCHYHLILGTSYLHGHIYVGQPWYDRQVCV